MDRVATSRCRVQSLLSSALDSAIDSGDWLAAEHILQAMEGLSRDGVISSSCVERAYLMLAREPNAPPGTSRG